MAERRIWRLVIRRPGKGLFPISLGNFGRSDPFERYPGSIGSNASLARDGISEVEQIMTPGKINGGNEQKTHKPQNHQSGQIDIRNHEAECEPGSGERLYGQD